MCAQMDVIRARARRDIAACRSRRSAPAPDPLRGFGGATFTTTKGHALTPQQFLGAVERFSRVPGYELLEWNADGSVKMPPRQTVSRMKRLPRAQLEAAHARLCTVAEAPQRPPPKHAVWVKQELVQVRSHVVLCSLVMAVMLCAVHVQSSRCNRAQHPDSSTVEMDSIDSAWRIAGNLSKPGKPTACASSDVAPGCVMNLCGCGMQGKWMDVEQPWRKLSSAAKTEKMRSMYDRCNAAI